MEELIKLLKDNGVEVTDDLRGKIKEIYPEEVDTDDLFTQEDVNKVVQKRLSREQKLHEQEIQELKDEMKDLVDPDKVKDYETKIEELEGNAKEREAELKKEYELKLAATNGGVTDLEYFEFLAGKKGLKDRLTVDDDGNVLALDEKGEVLKDDEGNQLGPNSLISELKEDKPDLFAEQKKDKKKSTGPTNPNGGAELTDDEKRKQSADLAAEMGYKTKDKE